MTGAPPTDLHPARRALAGQPRARLYDRLMAAQLIGSGGVAVLLLLSASMRLPAIIDVALMLAILAVFASIGFVNWGGHGEEQDGGERDA